MRWPRILIVCLALPVIAAIIYAATVGDATQAIQREYPSARVSLHQGHSDPRPVLAFIRLIRGRTFIPTSEWLHVTIENEPKPIDLALLRRHRVLMLELTRCKVPDLTGMASYGYIVFSSCDLSGASHQQLAELYSRSDDPATLVYGGP